MTRYVGFDLETTGVSPFTDVPVSFGFVEVTESHSGSEPHHFRGFVNPARPIPAGASAIHGITDDMVSDAPTLLESVDVLATTLSQIWCDGGVVVGMNLSYDLTMVDSLCRRLGLAHLDERGAVGPVLDVLVLDRHFDKWRKGSRKLTDLCAHYGVALESAHSAGDDAYASLLVLKRLRERFVDIDLLDAETINPTLRAWHQTWLSSYSSFLVSKGRRPVAEHEFDWPIHTDGSAPPYSSQLVS